MNGLQGFLSYRYAYFFRSFEEQELHNFLRNESNYKLESFLRQHEELVASTNYYNSWEKLNSTWTKRYRNALLQIKPNLRHVSKTLISVESSFWQTLYRRVKTGQNDQLQVQLLDWCTQLTHKKPVTANVEEIKSEITRIEQRNDKALVERLNLMSFKLLNSFRTLTHTEKCVLKLTVSNIINLSKKVYSDQYQKHLPLSVFESLSSLSLPTLTLSYEQQLQAHFIDFKKIIFDILETKFRERF